TEERRARIAGYLVNEGYELPPSPPNADYDEAGVIHWVRGQEMTVAYSVVDQGGRQVYYYVEWEIDHIMIGRIHSGDEWALEYLDRIPAILRRGKVMWEEPDRVIYHSRRYYQTPDGEDTVLQVVIQRARSGQWYVVTFYPPTRR
ncbi:MAG: hypothetical protein V3T90_01180, partial [Anaerolineae bacterium]